MAIQEAICCCNLCSITVTSQASNCSFHCGTYTIPAGVTALKSDLWGTGGSGSGYDGSSESAYDGVSGSYVKCQLAISGSGPTTINVIVGQGGRAPAYSTALGSITLFKNG